ncbi:hypothetical protein ACFYOT_05715 [Saccharothrix saharensis]|uniref:hypothetical protein n=1 Tax=Saccharothrix saharensis TaxID=571190 RepID=UPI00368612D9
MTENGKSFSERLAWLPATLVVLLPIAGTAFMSQGKDLVDGGDKAWFFGGIACFVAAAATQGGIAIWRRRRRTEQLNEAVRLRVAMKDALQPVVELMATMPYKSKRDRQGRLREVANRAVNALNLLLKGVDRVRAVVFELDEQAISLKAMAHHGRGTTPEGFTAGTVRGDRALEHVSSGKPPLLVRDLEKERPDEWEGTGKDYRTFISATIRSGDIAYGMLTVDAPKAGDLVDTDLQIVALMADLLAVSFAEADR